MKTLFKTFDEFINEQNEMLTEAFKSTNTGLEWYTGESITDYDKRLKEYVKFHQGVMKIAMKAKDSIERANLEEKIKYATLTQMGNAQFIYVKFNDGVDKHSLAKEIMNKVPEFDIDDITHKGKDLSIDVDWRFRLKTF